MGVLRQRFSISDPRFREGSGIDGHQVNSACGRSETPSPTVEHTASQVSLEPFVSLILVAIACSYREVDNLATAKSAKIKWACG